MHGIWMTEVTPLSQICKDPALILKRAVKHLNVLTVQGSTIESLGPGPCLGSWYVSPI
jgi:hypothetical protein